MEVISITEQPKQRVKICLDNGADFLLYKKEAARFHLEEGSDLSESAYELILTEILKPRCRKRALHLLEKQDRSRKNLSAKLKEGGYSDFLIEDALAYIDSFGYIDEDRMARSHIRFYQSSRSKSRIKQDLIGKGIPLDIIEICIEEEYQESELDQIKRLLEKKGYDASSADMNMKNKMYRFLMGRGFSSSEIRRALDEYEEF